MENRGFSLKLFLLGLFKSFLFAKLNEMSPENGFFGLYSQYLSYFFIVRLGKN